MFGAHMLVVQLAALVGRMLEERFTSSSMGMSMEVELGVIFLSRGVSEAIRRSLRELTETPIRSSNWVEVFSLSRRSPSSKCPLWMLSEPN
jgi:hypothetical protein